MRKSKKFKFLPLVLMFVMLIPLYGFFGSDDDGDSTKTSAEAVAPQSDLLPEEQKVIQIYNHNSKSVVNVTNIQVGRSWWDFGMVEVPQGAGSGFIWNSEGYIITNFHVVEGGNAFLVSFKNDHKQYKAKVVGVAPAKDLAVLKLTERPKEILPITVGTSKNLQVGQTVLAIGNPFGLDQTLTKGIVSALGRKIDGIGGVKIYGMIQTDASINPGNSGGPLLDSNGRLIGINTMIYSKSGSSSGVGFAVPVDTIDQIIPQLIKYGKVIRPGLGIGVLPDHVKEKFGQKIGIVITHVVENGPAAQAGLIGMGQDQYGRYYLGDIITSIDKRPINSYNDLYNILDDYKVGDVVTIGILREGKKQDAKLKLMGLGE